MRKLLLILTIFVLFVTRADIRNQIHYPLDAYIDSIIEILDIHDSIDIYIVPIIGPVAESMFRGLTQEISEKEYVIHMNRYLSKDQCIETLIHELIHVDDLVKDVLIQHINGTNEYIYKDKKYSFDGYKEEYNKPMEIGTRAKTDSIYSLFKN